MKMLPLALLALSLPAFSQEAPLSNIKINGWGFVRNETKKDADYQNEVKDDTNFTQTRINIGIRGDLAEKYGYVFFAPQFSKISGQDEFATTGTNNTRTSSSGNLYDSKLDLHEAYFALMPTKKDNLVFYAGRQELAYGDQLILGAVPWHRIGRSFDGVKGSYRIKDKVIVDAFTMKLQENNSAANSLNGEDSDFHGLYVKGDFGSYFKEVDLYALKKDNQKSGDFKDTSAYGLRLKSKVGKSSFDYRAETTLEQVMLSADEKTEEGEYQYDVELGYTTSFYSTRLAFEYFSASKNYDQLFPTAHKFLGFADQFSRRNIQGYAAHLSSVITENITFLADYHVFQRNNTNAGAYNFSGTSLGTTGSKRELANELDLIIAYNFTKTLQLSYGYSWVTPGEYFKDQNDDKQDITHWSFLQLLAKF